jgi:hypothetical protein
MTDFLGHIAYKLANAEVRPFPFPHIYVQNIFPADFYEELLWALPDADTYKGNPEGKYRNRKFHDAVIDLIEPMRSTRFTQSACKPFERFITKRLGTSFPAAMDLRLVLDSKNYSIGPHTDARHKVLSYLFYLPEDDSLIKHGTSIYVPRDPDFRCPGGPHHAFAPFERVATMPFVPNSLFAFFKTDQSFHGVEPITIPCCRNVLLWNLYTRG